MAYSQQPQQRPHHPPQNYHQHPPGAAQQQSFRSNDDHQGGRSRQHAGYGGQPPKEPGAQHYDDDDFLDMYGGGGQEDSRQDSYGRGYHDGYDNGYEPRPPGGPRGGDGYGAPPYRQPQQFPEGDRGYGGYPARGPPPRGPPMGRPTGPPSGYPPRGPPRGPPNGPPRGPPPNGYRQGPGGPGPRSMPNGGYGPAPGPGSRPRNGPPLTINGGRGPISPHGRQMGQGYDSDPQGYAGPNRRPRQDENSLEQGMRDLDMNGRPFINQRPSTPNGRGTPGANNDFAQGQERRDHYGDYQREVEPVHQQNGRFGPPAPISGFSGAGEPLGHNRLEQSSGPQHLQGYDEWQQPHLTAAPVRPTAAVDPIDQRAATTQNDHPSTAIEPPARPSTAGGSKKPPVGHRVRPFDVPFHGEPARAQIPQSAGDEVPAKFGFESAFPATAGGKVQRQDPYSAGSGVENSGQNRAANHNGPLDHSFGGADEYSMQHYPAPGAAQGIPIKAPQPGFYGNTQGSMSQPNLGRPSDAGGPPYDASQSQNRPSAGGYNGYEDGRTNNNHRQPPQSFRNDPYGQESQAQAMNPATRQFHRPGAPPLSRLETAQSGFSDPGPGGEHMGGPNGFNRVDPRAPLSRQGTPLSAGGLPMQQSHSQLSNPYNPDALPSHPAPSNPVNPDALPAHPAPVRPGLSQHGGQMIAGGSSNRVPSNPQQSIPPPQTPQQSNVRPDRRLSVPVTFAELARLRAELQKNPNDFATQLFLAKRLVNAAATLAEENGGASARQAAKNRENYIFEAHRMIKKLISTNYPDAMFYLADCYGTGQLGLAVDPKEAFSYYQQAAKLNHAASAYRTAVCCEMGSELGGGTRKEPQKAVQWYRRAAALGDVPAMYKLGMIMLKGLLGQPATLGEAMIWLQRAAERADEENPHALHELAVLYETAPNGGKVIRDEGYAFQCYDKAAKFGYARSQTRLGKAYEYGQLGLAIDNRSSIHWYSKAAAQEDHDAELALSGWYLTGSAGILEQNDQEAYLWARKAALAEMSKAEYAMGYFSEVGIGCPRSLEDAKRWYGRAAAHKYLKAQERLEELRRGGAKAQRGRERISQSRNGRGSDECTIM